MSYEPQYIADDPTRTYSDLDLSMSMHPITRDIVRKYNIEAIKASVKHLVLLNFYEKPLHPEIGCGIYRYLFENLEMPGTANRIKKVIKNTLALHEPRARVNNVYVLERPDDNAVEITVDFTPINQTEIVSVTQLLKISR